MAYRWGYAPAASRSASSSRTTSGATGHGLLPAPPRDPALHLVLPLDGADDSGCDRQLADLDLHRQAAGRPAPADVRLRPLPGAPRRLPLSRRQSVSRLLGRAGEYPIDIQVPAEPVAQPRWTIFFRLPLAIPALLVSGALAGLSGGNVGSSRGKTRYSSGGGALLVVCAFLGWFASLARGRMPKGLRDAGAYSIGYTAQLTAYLLLVTDRYPNADPTEMLVGRRAAAAPSRARRRRPVRPAPLAAHRLLPAAARAAAPHLARALGSPRVRRGDPAVVRDALPRHARASVSIASSRPTSATGCT